MDQQTFLTAVGISAESSQETAVESFLSTRSANVDSFLNPFTTADNAAFDMNGSDFSIAMWINPSAFGGDGGGRSSGLFIKGTDTQVANYAYYALIDANDKIIVSVSDGTTGTAHQHQTVLSTDTWYFVVITYTNSTKEIAISVNDGTPETATHDGTDVQDNTSALTIGHNRGSNTDAMQGRLDLIGIWKKKLSSAEITSLYNSGNGKIYAGLTAGEKTSLSAYWNMDEESDGTGAVTRADSHTNSLDLTDENTIPSGLPVPD